MRSRGSATARTRSCTSRCTEEEGAAGSSPTGPLTCVGDTGITRPRTRRGSGNTSVERTRRGRSRRARAGRGRARGRGWPRTGVGVQAGQEGIGVGLADELDQPGPDPNQPGAVQPAAGGQHPARIAEQRLDRGGPQQRELDGRSPVRSRHWPDRNGLVQRGVGRQVPLIRPDPAQETGHGRQQLGQYPPPGHRQGRDLHVGLRLDA